MPGVEEGTPEAETPPISGSASPPDSAALQVKTDWIPSDAPKDAGISGDHAFPPV